MPCSDAQFEIVEIFVILVVIFVVDVVQVARGGDVRTKIRLRAVEWRGRGEDSE